MRKLSRTKNVVTDFCVGTCCTAKGCVLLGQQRAFEVESVDSEMLINAEAEHFFSLAVRC